MDGERLIKLEAEGVEREIAIETENIIVNKPSGEIEITANGNYDVGQYATAEVAVAKPTATISITENGTFDVENYKTAKVQTTSGEIEITSNGTVDVDKYQSASVNVPAEILSAEQMAKSGWSADDVAATNENLVTAYSPTDEQLATIAGITVEVSGGSAKFVYSDGTAVNSDYSLRYLPNVDFGEATSLSTWLCNTAPDIRAIPNWDLSKFTSASSMLKNCYLLVSVPALNLPAATDCSALLSNCYSLVSVPALNLPAATTVSALYRGCQGLVSITGLSAPNVTGAGYLCRECYSLTTISGLDLPSATDTSYMLQYCTSLQYADLSSIDFANKVTTYDYMLYNVPTDCEFVVATDADKDWFATKFPDYTNVKTKAEKDAE